MIHKEGIRTIILVVFLVFIWNTLIYFFGGSETMKWLGYGISFFFLIMILQFFRNPSRKIPYNENHILSPADGKIVTIEEVFEDEYFHDRRIQISVFMSPIDVHVNRYPISGKISYFKYHPGKYLVAWHPKSSTENEHTTIVIFSPIQKERESGRVREREILFRQIAGTLARRIVFYGKEGDEVRQGSECGFIKFGSRVDVLLPLNSKVKVKINDKVMGGVSVIAEV